jgi:hypothetical protein
MVHLIATLGLIFLRAKFFVLSIEAVPKGDLSGRPDEVVYVEAGMHNEGGVYDVKCKKRCNNKVI